MAKYNLSHTAEALSAEKLRADQRQQIEAIRANRNLSPEGKRAQIASVYLRAKKEVAKLEQQEATARANRIHSLRKSVFGLGLGYQSAQDMISYRDAQDRVASLGHDDEDKASQLLDRAELSGDTVLASAVVNRALEAGWVNVANAYIEAHPHYGSMVEELWDLNQASPENETNIGKAFENSFAFHLEKPHEIGHLNMESQIEAVANEA
ncbi:hypothetical protein RI444_07650 [Paenarthrobacter sp. AT5]|uniref:hypothetical protein n=1 Tax=Paenarthrobacter TaxID=1742992 RepID=UPI001A992447|nr:MULTISPECIES: hypothetical protein [Paenarthrobacter]QSZ54496.1 hypothetical protein AYX19_16920 [Paenarthrobacter ureafaciens]WOC62485.1 hypothetical protein RI444_07650 [Paenarthrobacter sp. AT5]